MRFFMHDSYKKLVRWMNRLFSRIEAKLSNQIKYIRLSYSMAAILFAIMSSSIFEYAAKEKFLSDSQIKFAQYAVVIVLVLFCFQLVYILLDIFLGSRTYSRLLQSITMSSFSLTHRA